MESSFTDCSKDSSLCEPLVSEAVAPLQQVALRFPTDADVANVQFVLRTEEGDKWFRDGVHLSSCAMCCRQCCRPHLGCAAPQT